MTTTANINYWSLLGLEPGSGKEELKKAFRREARKWHPDLNINDNNAEERFKLINEAYEILSDPKKREVWQNKYRDLIPRKDNFEEGFPSYEKYIEVVLGLREFQDSESSYQYIEDNIEENYNTKLDSDYCDENQQNQWPTPSKEIPPPVHFKGDLESIIELTPEQALNGTFVELELENGLIVEVKTPPFAGDGWRLRLEGVAPGNRDHFIQLKVETDNGLRIDGLKVLYKLELFPPEALLGCAVEIPTLNGDVTLQVPPYSSSGRLLRLRGRGVQFDDLQGDQFVEIVIVLPSEVSDSEQALYKRLQELSLEEDFL